VVSDQAKLERLLHGYKAIELEKQTITVVIWNFKIVLKEQAHLLKKDPLFGAVIKSVG
jgi:hypothetical protein